MNLATQELPTARVFRGQLPKGTRGQFSVWEWFRDGSAIIRNFDDEFLASQCAVALGTHVETNELELSMKTIIQEHEGCFSIDLQAETLGEAALLTRMGVDARERINHLATNVSKGEGANGNASDVAGRREELFSFNCTLAKAKKANSYLPRRIAKPRRR